MTLSANRFLDTSSSAFAQDPHLIFDDLRAETAVVRDAIGWSTIDYATSEAAFHDPSLTPGIDHLLAMRGIEHLWGEPGHTLTDSEGLTHQRLRRAVSPWFSARRIEQLRARTRALVDELLGQVGPGEPFDVVADLADVIPARVFCWMIGAPEVDAPALARLSKALLSVFTATEEMVAPVRIAKVELADYTRSLLASRATGVGVDDLTSVLVAGVRAGHLEPDDSFFLLEELLSASVDNTANTTAVSVYTLVEQPGVWSALHADPLLLPAAVEECGRYEPAIRHTIKVATAATHIGEQLVEEGEFVTVRIAAAHRDPDAFDDPHRFDLMRVKPKPQLSFGAGRHYCLGAALGKMEVTEMLDGLTSRWSAVEFGSGLDIDRHVAGTARCLPLRGVR